MKANSPDPAPLAIEGPRFNFNFEKGEFKINEIPIFISRAEKARGANEQDHGDTGRTIWDSAVVLAKFLEKNGKKCIIVQVLQQLNFCSSARRRREF